MYASSAAVQGALAQSYFVLMYIFPALGVQYYLQNNRESR